MSATGQHEADTDVSTVDTDDTTERKGSKRKVSRATFQTN